ncbi:RDD family protein [Carboxylicivirga sp. A043]|uniref:RDD family protein n=1 Tax=Carboxylicivirga litoralis TaxID=2816963 RepID=UPI0021CB8EFC|nr:RDD family protein [Carboxylicivirga sp. A043]MCU4158119.1 RDD family protein [Carboxylicivirga sp. A043]
MNREHQLRFCKACLHQKNDNERGLICRITHDTPNFTSECTTYHEDKFLKNKYELHEVAKCLQCHQASKGQRIVNGLIDWAFSFLFFILTINLFNVVIPETNQMPNLIVFKYTLGAVAIILYYSIMESITGRTFGKMITGTKVVSESGQQPPLSSILMRSVYRIIPIDWLSLLYWKYECGHDRWTKTRVVLYQAAFKQL